jgi:RNA polymerase sigma-70 factor (ECF subfamily)
MTSTSQQIVINGFVSPLTATAPSIALDFYQHVFEQHRHKIYSLAFWMTDNEITAEEISTTVFARTFSRTVPYSDSKRVAEDIDRNLVSVLREYMPIGSVTLEVNPSAQESIKGNTKRIHLERAVVQIPATERLVFLMHDVENYRHADIATTLGITEDESKYALCQARILVRELIAQQI